MENVTLGNRSRIPRANFTAPRLGHAVSNSGISFDAGNIAVGGNMRRTQPTTQTKAVLQPGSARPVSQARSFKPTTFKPTTLKRQATTSQENAPVAKGQALAPPPNQKRKLPPWDFKGKLILAEERNVRLKNTRDKQEIEIAQLQSHNETLGQQVPYLEAELREKTSQLEYESLLHSQCQERADILQMKYDDSEQHLKLMSESLQSANQSLEIKEERLRLLSSEVEELKCSSSEREAVLSALEKRLSESENSLKHFEEECLKLQEKVQEQEVQCKALHNKVMELKGNKGVLPSKTTPAFRK